VFGLLSYLYGLLFDSLLKVRVEHLAVCMSVFQKRVWALSFLDRVHCVHCCCMVCCVWLPAACARDLQMHRFCDNWCAWLPAGGARNLQVLRFCHICMVCCVWLPAAGARNLQMLRLSYLYGVLCLASCCRCACIAGAGQSVCSTIATGCSSSCRCAEIATLWCGFVENVMINDIVE